jgi:hypothetical protein
VINAGANYDRQTVEEGDPADWQRTLEVNLTGAFADCRNHRSTPGERMDTVIYWDGETQLPKEGDPAGYRKADFSLSLEEQKPLSIRS